MATRNKTVRQATAKSRATPSIPAILRVSGSAAPLHTLIEEAVAAGLPITLPANASDDAAHDALPPTEIEDASAIDPSLTVESGSASPPKPGTSYAGLSPAQRFAFIEWSRRPETSAPLAYQQLFLANVEARLLDDAHRELAHTMLRELGDLAVWQSNAAFHRTLLLACWLAQDGEWLAGWISANALPNELLGTALGMQALMDVPMTAAELGAAIVAWHLGEHLPDELLKLRLDSLTAILGQPPLAYALSRLDAAAQPPRPWRSAHRGLRLLVPQPDVRVVLEPSLADALAVADVREDEAIPTGTLPALETKGPATSAQQEAETEPTMDDLGWRLILEFGSNRSEYFDYVLIQAQKLPGYSQIMDEDRRMVYRIIFRKSEMRRFWRIWDYVHGWTATRVYLNGVELEKWKVWPYSQYLR